MAVQGKLLYMTVDGNEINCQTDLTLNMTANTTDEEACKPLSTETTDASLWITRTVASKEWDASVSAKTIISAVTANNTNIATLAGLFITGTNQVEVAIQVNSGHDDFGEPQTFVFTGNAIMNGFTLNAPIEGDSTGDVTFVSNGAPTWTQTTVVGG